MQASYTQFLLADVNPCSRIGVQHVLKDTRFKAVISGSPLLGAILFGLFGLGRASLIWPMSLSMKSLEQIEYTISKLTKTTALVHLTNGIALAFAGGIILGKLWLGLNGL